MSVIMKIKIYVLQSFTFYIPPVLHETEHDRVAKSVQPSSEYNVKFSNNLPGNDLIESLNYRASDGDSCSCLRS